jgi:hypothetical protein
VLGRTPGQVPMVGLDQRSLLAVIEAVVPVADYRLSVGPGGISVELAAPATSSAARHRVARQCADALAAAGARRPDGRPLVVDVVTVPTPRLLPSGKADRLDPTMLGAGPGQRSAPRPAREVP